jgi:hypothetical protein
VNSLSDLTTAGWITPFECDRLMADVPDLRIADPPNRLSSLSGLSFDYHVVSPSGLKAGLKALKGLLLS